MAIKKLDKFMPKAADGVKKKIAQCVLVACFGLSGASHANSWIDMDISGGYSAVEQKESLAKNKRKAKAIESKAHARPEDPVGTALAYLGAPYRLGGESRRGLDCSALTKNAWSGTVDLPRTAREQASFGAEVSKDRLAEGDLVFFRKTSTGPVSHVGIYVGEGKFAHASQAAGRVIISSLTGSHWRKSWAGARRPAGTVVASSGRGSSQQEFRAVFAEAMPRSMPVANRVGEGLARQEFAGLAGTIAASQALGAVADGGLVEKNALPQVAWDGLLSNDLPDDIEKLKIAGRAVPRERVSDGDLLLFRVEGKIGLAGIYVGDGFFVLGGSDGGVHSLSDAKWTQALAGVRRVGAEVENKSTGPGSRT